MNLYYGLGNMTPAPVKAVYFGVGYRPKPVKAIYFGVNYRPKLVWKAPQDEEEAT